MTKELEERLELLEKQLHSSSPPPRKKRKTHLLVILITLCLLAAGMAGGLIYRSKEAAIFNPKIHKAVSFPIYYPSPMPAGYTHNKNSAKVENGVLFFSVQSGNKMIRISEQTTPDHPPDINSIPGLKKLETLAGSAAIGSTSGQPIGLLLTNTTLITVNGTNDIPNDIIANIVKSMTSIGN